MVKRTSGEKVFQVLNIFLMFIIMATVLLPIMHIFSVSVSNSRAITTLGVGLLPVGFNPAAYIKLIGEAIFKRSLINTVIITAASTVFSLVVIIMVAYALSKKYFLGKKFFVYFFVVTMYFSGGLIPSYLLVSKYLRLNNTYLAYILPVLVNVFYIIVVKSQVEAIPPDLIEAAYIDGAGEYKVLFNIIIPVIKPTAAAIGMFIVLNCWNMWFPVLLYTDRREMWTMQYYLRAVVFEKFLANNAENAPAVVGADVIPPQNYQMACIILVSLPIVSVYPFVQKYFVKGILAGSVKG
ncbi:MAG: carbohydrate ABC transporter permease [Clostridiaceae bacterium]